MDIRESLSAAFEKAETAAATDSTQEPVAAEPAATEAPETSSADVSATPYESKPKVEVKPTESKKPVTPGKPHRFSKTNQPVKTEHQSVSTSTQAPEAGATTKTDTLKAPYSWNAVAKGIFPTLPPEIQQESVRVDREARTMVQQAGEAKKFQQAFKETVAPYEGLLRSAGVEPIAAVDELFRTFSALRTGTKLQRAQVAVNLINNNDVDVGLVDQLLAGKVPQQQAQQEQYHDKRLDVLLSQLQQRQQSDLQQSRAQALSEVEQFRRTHEFLEDLEPGMEAPRGSIRDRMTKFLQTDPEISLEDAYKYACLTHPDISKAIQQRELAKQSEVARVGNQRAMIASSSVRNEPAGIAIQQKNGKSSIRDSLSRSWDMYNGG